MFHNQLSKFVSRIRTRLLIRLLVVAVLVGMAPPQASFAETPDPLPAADAAPSLASTAAGCENVYTMGLNQTVSRSLLRRAPQVDWLRFSVQQGERYRLELTNAAGLLLAVYDACSTDGPAVELQDGTLEFTATRSGDYYLLVHNSAGVAAAASFQATFAAAEPHPASLVAVSNIPVEAQRRAIDFLEELRGSDLAPEWINARVNPEARILYRPDIDGPAYYEFTVEKPNDAGGWENAGFIQLSAGEHDYPISHWDATGDSPTDELAELAPLSVQITQFYKLDALSYVAEHEQITVLGLNVVTDTVTNLGDIPGRLGGLESYTKENPAEEQSYNLAYDENGNKIVDEYEGPEEPAALSRGEEWEDFATLKAEYEEEFGPLLESLAERVEDEWTLEENLDQHGETLIQGDVRTINALPNQAITSYQVTGEGAAEQYLQQEELTEENALVGLRLTVLDEPADPQTLLPVNVTLTYSGTNEIVRYNIANSDALTGIVPSILLPSVTLPANEEVAAAGTDAGAATAGDWGPWHYYWVEQSGEANNTNYGQFSYAGCASGCGGTAWAMLFSWVDRRAADNSGRWWPHDGIYRSNGGLGADVKAPLFQDDGVRNMTIEIRSDISTFCIAGSGATWPWNMIDASGYVHPRATAAWRMSTRYDPTGLCWFGACNDARNLAIDAIVNKQQPAIVGTGWLKHYPMALGYAWRSKQSCFLWWCSTDYSRWFWVNNGWYGNNNGWTSADVWFGGTYYDN